MQRFVNEPPILSCVEFEAGSVHSLVQPGLITVVFVGCQGKKQFT
jgi:hypothetical protein